MYISGTDEERGSYKFKVQVCVPNSTCDQRGTHNNYADVYQKSNIDRFTFTIPPSAPKMYIGDDVYSIIQIQNLHQIFDQLTFNYYY